MRKVWDDDDFAKRRQGIKRQRMEMKEKESESEDKED